MRQAEFNRHYGEDVVPACKYAEVGFVRDLSRISTGVFDNVRNGYTSDKIQFLVRPETLMPILFKKQDGYPTALLLESALVGDMVFPAGKIVEPQSFSGLDCLIADENYEAYEYQEGSIGLEVIRDSAFRTDPNERRQWYSGTINPNGLWVADRKLTTAKETERILTLTPEDIALQICQVLNKSRSIANVS